MSKIIGLLEKYGGVPPENGKYLGKIIAIPPLGGDETFNITFPKGKGSEMWVSFLCWLTNKGYKIQKFDESLEVSPVDSGYYALTQRQKEEMEAKIKHGLESVASTVAEYELLMHDLRRYKEFLKLITTNDEHALRAIFIDEVDINTGANSIKQMVARWPTIIVDFLTLGEKMPEEENPEKIKNELKISKAEAVILATKQKLYKNWKKIFGSEIRERTERILALVNSRKKAIEEYKNSLRPLIARHKLYKEGLSEKAKEKLTDVWYSPGQAISSNIIEIWAWKPFSPIEPRVGTLEIRKMAIEPYDEWTQEKIIFNEEEGLKKYYNYEWFNKEWVDKQVEEIKKEWLTPDKLYYVFFQIRNYRYVIRTPTGDEIEDVTIETKSWFLSQNALLVLLLELKIKQEIFEREIDALLGIKSAEGLKTSEQLEKIVKEWKEVKKKEEKKVGEKVKNLKKFFSKFCEIFHFDVMLAKLGPYEHNFADRITELYLKQVMTDFYIPDVVSYFLEKGNIGK